MEYEFLRAIAENTEIEISDLSEATFAEYKKVYKSAREDGLSRSNSLKFSIAANAYRDDLREKSGMKEREKAYRKASKEYKKQQKQDQKGGK